MEVVTIERAPKTKKHALILAERLGLARKAMNPAVSQRQVAKELNVASATVSLWEAGKTQPDVDTIVFLAQWFNQSIDWLYGVESPTSKRAARLDASMNTVPVISLTALGRWSFGEPIGTLQTHHEYPTDCAAAVRIGATSAMPNLVGKGGYLVVTRTDRADVGSVVVALERNATEPVIRRVVKDGSTILYMADDPRYPALRADHCRLVGKVTEVISHSILLQ